MKLESVGLILSLRAFGERDAVAYIFTRTYGLMTGMMKGAIVAKKNKPLVGQCGNASWNARLDSQLGVFHWESAHNLAAPLMGRAAVLPCMNSTFALLTALLPERVKYEQLFSKTLRLLSELAAADANAAELYLDWEISLLSDLGYALDLSRCSGCGKRDDLTHLSPKTGRAVCGACAAPYASRLLPLPVDLNATKFFIARILSEQGGRDLPWVRTLIT
jgi:DNA repair protein RecO (recombination protein O)